MPQGASGYCEVVGARGIEPANTPWCSRNPGQAVRPGRPEARLFRDHRGNREQCTACSTGTV